MTGHLKEEIKPSTQLLEIDIKEEIAQDPRHDQSQTHKIQVTHLEVIKIESFSTPRPRIKNMLMKEDKGHNETCSKASIQRHVISQRYR